jgi:hypothetical protein
MERAKYLFDKIIAEGETAIDEFIATRKSEELFLEFKRGKDDGRTCYFHDIDRGHLAKAISGFGNSEGGIIVWGVGCSKNIQDGDTAQSKTPITNAKRYRSWIEGAVSSCTVPPHKGVRSSVVCERDNGEGYIITLIPKSMDAPHQNLVDYKYYIRAGSSFMPTPHSVLAGMFGKRPQPNVFHAFVCGPTIFENERIINPIGILIHNHGPGIAQDLFLGLSILSLPGEKCMLSLETIDSSKWIASVFLKQKISVISNPEVRIATDQEVMAISFRLVTAPPFTDNLKIQGICGCGQSPPYRFTIVNDYKTIKMAYDKFQAKSREGTFTKQDGDELIKQLWISESEKRD